MRYEVEYWILLPERVRDMPEDVFDAFLVQHEEKLREYRARFAEQRKRQVRWSRFAWVST